LWLCHLDGDAIRQLAATPPRSAAAIRPARPADAPRLAAMLEGLMRAVGETPAEGDVAERLAADRFGPEPRFAALLAECAGKPGGYALFWPVYDTDLGGEVLFLSDLFVAEPARRGGVAWDLMAAVARYAATSGFRQVFWEVLAHNQPARAFYRRIARESNAEFVVTCAGEDFRKLIAHSASRDAGDRRRRRGGWRRRSGCSGPAGRPRWRSRSRRRR